MEEKKKKINKSNEDQEYEIFIENLNKKIEQGLKEIDQGLCVPMSKATKEFEIKHKLTKKQYNKKAIKMILREDSEGYEANE